MMRRIRRTQRMSLPSSEDCLCSIGERLARDKSVAAAVHEMRHRGDVVALGRRIAAPLVPERERDAHGELRLGSFIGLADEIEAERLLAGAVIGPAGNLDQAASAIAPTISRCLV